MAVDNSTPPPIAPEEFVRVRRLYGSQQQAADACGVGLKQLRRWESGQSPVPLAPYRLMVILGERDLGEIEPSWRGWLLRGEALGTPEGETLQRTLHQEMPYLIGAAHAREYKAAQLAEQLKSECQQLRDALQKFKDAAAPRRACSGPAKQRRQGGSQAPVIEQPKPPSRYKSLDPHAREKLLEWYERVLAALDADDMGEPDGAGEIREEILMKRRAVLEDDIEAMGRLGVVGLKRDHIHLVWPPHD